MKPVTLAVLLTMASAGIAAAQPTTSAPNAGSACPPGTAAGAPSVGQDSSRPLSDQLTESKGVICPPAGVDPEMRQPPPEGGAMRVIPPPGAPGGNPDVQPK